MSDEKRLTPAMEQYRFFKAKYPDAILFFRMGDFYETFETDAETIAPVLGIALTSRSKDKSGKRIPLAGVPYHAGENYIAKLVSNGFKVAICEQVEDPKYAKGVVKRDVVRVITPGTVIDDAYLSSTDSHYLMVISAPGKDDNVGVAFLELSTGEFFVF